MQRVVHRMHLLTTIRMLSGFDGKNSVCAFGGGDPGGRFAPFGRGKGRDRQFWSGLRGGAVDAVATFGEIDLRTESEDRSRDD